MTTRPIIATIHRGRTTKQHSRRYSTPEAALTRAIPWLLRDGRVNSLVEIADLNSGVQFAVARVTATGKISLTFMFKELENA
jgi:hypothetical protein